MLIIGCDYHPGFQQIACVDTDTGELSEHRLAHREQAEQFYRELKQKNLCARVGMESSGHSRWFERLLQELGFELWIGDPAEIRTKRVRKQKTDRQDAQLILQLMLENQNRSRRGKSKSLKPSCGDCANGLAQVPLSKSRTTGRQSDGSTGCNENAQPAASEQNRSSRVRMEAWRQWLLGGKRKTLSNEKIKEPT